MEVSLPKPITTLVVILGASKFPRIKALNPNRAFEASAEAFKEYLVDPKGFNLPLTNLLYIFNTLDSPAGIDDKIAKFLEKGIQKFKALDVLVYYVGHGAFTNDGNTDYFLTLVNTKTDQERSSGYQIQSLATTLKRFATHLRKYIILDCCFSAVAYTTFQSGPIQVAIQQTLDQFEVATKGTALLCAASKDVPAKVLPNFPYTMFSTALLDVLRDGVNGALPVFSFVELRDLISKRIKEIYLDEAVRPEVHSPDQKKGDISRLPIFPNTAKRHTNSVEKKNEFKNRVELDSRNYVNSKSQESETPMQMLLDELNRIYFNVKDIEQELLSNEYLGTDSLNLISSLLKQVSNVCSSIRPTINQLSLTTYESAMQVKKAEDSVKDMLMQMLKDSTTNIKNFNKLKNRFCLFSISLRELINNLQKNFS